MSHPSWTSASPTIHLFKGLVGAVDAWSFMYEGTEFLVIAADAMSPNGAHLYGADDVAYWCEEYEPPRDYDTVRAAQIAAWEDFVDCALALGYEARIIASTVRECCDLHGRVLLEWDGRPFFRDQR